MAKRILLLLIIPMLLTLSPALSQDTRTGLSGNLTIGPETTDDYATFTAAVNDLIASGVAEGGVTFLVTPGTYPERITLNTFTGASESSQVIFQADGGEVTLNGTGTSGTLDAMVILNGVSWVTFDGINILDGGTTASDRVEIGYVITGTATQGSNYNTIKNASIMMGGGENPELRNARGVSFISNATQASGSNNFNTLHNLTIDRVGWGVRVAGKTALFGAIQFADEGNVVSGCTFGSNVRIGHNEASSAIGIQIQAQKNIRVFDNIIDSVFSTPAASPALPVGSRGISVDAGAGEIFNNQINYVRYQGAGASSAIGIRITVLEEDTMKIYNNFISNVSKSNEYVPPSFDNSMYVMGIWSFAGTGGGGSLELYHNTVVLDHEVACDFPSAAIYASASSSGIPPVIMYNNIMINNLTPSLNYDNNHGNTSFAFVEGNPNPGTLESNNNLFYVSDPNAILIQKGRQLGATIVDYSTLPAWSAATGHDTESVSKMINFVDYDSGDLHLAGASISDPQLAGTPIEGIDFDIDYDERGEIPGMGADEYDPSDAVVNLQGTVTNAETDEPLQGVQISIGDFQVQTGPAGGYSLSILPGEYTLTAEKADFEPFSLEITIPGTDTIIDFQMTPVPIPMAMVTGIIEGSDQPGTGIENAQIHFTGEEEFPAVFTDAQGVFSIELPSGISYTYRAVATGYEPVTGSITPAEGDYDMGVIVLTEFPFEPLNVTATLVDDAAEVQWDAPIPGLFTGFRYDSGIVSGQLGFQNGTENSVMGAVHRRNAVIDEISWYLTGEGGPHNLVNIFVFGLDEEGMPDRNELLYIAPNVNNTDDEWNTHVLPESLSVPNGFLIGVSTSGFLAMAHDTGAEPWEFQPNTQFATANFLQNDFLTLESLNFQVNFLIRAAGVDFGPASYDKQLPVATNTIQPENAPVAVSMQTPRATSHYSEQLPRVLLDYSVFRLMPDDADNPEAWELLEEETTATGYTDAQWNELEAGEYLYAVIARYSGDVMSEASFSNILIAEDEPDPITVTINVTDENLAPLADAVVTLQNGDTYNGNTGTDGMVVFTEVNPGTYDLLVTAAGYNDKLMENINITESVTLDIVLEEIINSIIGEEGESFRIFPNPAREYFRVDAGTRIEIIEVHDIFGKLIHRSTPAQSGFEINTDNWSPGQYFVTLISADNQVRILKIQVL
ncbi:MAG: T9SS C-terminal target domain-containing protein [Bacteroidetes bacterium]|nr:MAG: T9SS C-terminal target domain-containing protein [Bacteroidota bacterium]